MTTKNLNIVEGCGKEQPASSAEGAEIFICGQPNSRDANHPWYCRKCKNKYVKHLEKRVDELEPIVDAVIEGASIDEVIDKARDVQSRVVEGAAA